MYANMPGVYKKGYDTSQKFELNYISINLDGNLLFTNMVRIDILLLTKKC
jgi:hypothetical protein